MNSRLSRDDSQPSEEQTSGITGCRNGGAHTDRAVHMCHIGQKARTPSQSTDRTGGKCCSQGLRSESPGYREPYPEAGRILKEQGQRGRAEAQSQEWLT